MTFSSPLPGLEQTTDTHTCTRCGTYGELIELWQRNWCRDCLARFSDGEIKATALVGAAFGLLPPLFGWSVGMLTLIQLPILLLHVLVAVPPLLDNVYYFVELLAAGAVVHAMLQRLIVGRTDYRAAWGRSKHAYGQVLYATWMSNLITALFLFLLIVPGVMRMLSYAICLEVALMEDVAGAQAMERSTARMYGTRMTAFIAYLLAAIPMLVWFMLLVVVGALLPEDAVLVGRLLVVDAISILTHSVVALPLYALSAVLYVRLTGRAALAGQHI